MATPGYQSAGLKRRKFARKVKGYIILSTSLFAVFGLVYLFCFSPLMRVRDFIVVGVDSEQKDRILDVLRPQVAASRLGGLLGTNHYFSWQDSLRYEDVRSNRVSINKHFFSRTIEIVIHPRLRYGVWCFVSPENVIECTWVDASGVAFEPAPLPAGQLVMSFFELASTTSPVLGTPLIKQEHFEVIKRVAESLSILELAVNEIVVDRDLEEVRLQTVLGPRISFSLRFDPSVAALPALKKLINSPGIAGMRTIDFTVENRVFYTLK